MAFQFPASPTVGQQFSPAVGVTYEWDGQGWVFLGPTAASVYPPGVVVPYAGVTVSPLPFQGWLLCDGSSYAIATYPALYTVLGYQYGGSGANFNVPDLRGRAVFGKDNMGGSTAGRLTAAGSSVNGTILGNSGGLEAVTLTIPQIPAHQHGGATGLESAAHIHAGTTDSENAVHSHSGTTGTDSNDHYHSQVGSTGTGTQAPGGSYGDMATTLTGGASAYHTHNFTTGSESANHQHTFSTGTESANHLHSISAEGGGLSHMNLPPALILNYIIKT